MGTGGMMKFIVRQLCSVNTNVLFSCRHRHVNWTTRSSTCATCILPAKKIPGISSYNFTSFACAQEHVIIVFRSVCHLYGRNHLILQNFSWVFIACLVKIFIYSFILNLIEKRSCGIQLINFLYFYSLQSSGINTTLECHAGYEWKVRVPCRHSS